MISIPLALFLLITAILIGGVRAFINFQKGFGITNIFTLYYLFVLVDIFIPALSMLLTGEMPLKGSHIPIFSREEVAYGSIIAVVSFAFIYVGYVLTISIFNNGDMFRDFTYIDDITNGIILCCNKPANANQKFDRYNPDPSTSFAPHRIFNIGNNQPIKLMQFIKILEETLGIKAIKEFKSMQNGDVQGTYADTSKLQEWVGFKAETSINQGITQFVRWYKKYYSFEK